MSHRALYGVIATTVVAACWSGCGGGTADTSGGDASASSSGSSHEAGTPDGSVHDSGSSSGVDSSTADTGSPETGGGGDAAAETGGGVDAASETGVDAGSDTGTVAESGTPDTGAADTGVADTGTPDAGSDAPPDGPSCTPGVVAACGRGGAGVYCAPVSGSAFSTAIEWQPPATAFSDANGWKSSASYYDTIQFPDVNGDGLADVCGRGPGGATCALGTGVAFGVASTWQQAGVGAFSDANGWNGGPQYYATIQFPDVNGDGKADTCGRGGGGINCAISDGTQFSVATIWQAAFSDANAWNSSASYWSTIQYPDVNGDGKADVCGRGGGGINCALSSGTSFGAVGIWQAAFSDANAWNSSPAYYETIAFPDVNGDGKADVCGRGTPGIVCALSDGTQFGTVTTWQAYFADSNAWKNGAYYYGTIQFPDLNGDGKADVCGRGVAGLDCALSDGTKFGTIGSWQVASSAFSDPNAWNSGPQYYETIAFPDLDGDGKADACGRGNLGIWCGISDGVSSFGTALLWQVQPATAYSDGNGWNGSPSNWGTIGYPIVSAGTCKPGHRPTPFLRESQRFGM